MKTTFMQRKEDVVRDWYIIDAKNIPLGRVASKAAVLLRGKHKATYTPHIDLSHWQYHYWEEVFSFPLMIH